MMSTGFNISLSLPFLLSPLLFLFFSFLSISELFFLFCWIYSIVGAFLEKAMAPHSSTLAWKIPGTEEPGGQQSMGL